MNELPTSENHKSSRFSSTCRHTFPNYTTGKKLIPNALVSTTHHRPDGLFRHHLTELSTESLKNIRPIDAITPMHNKSLKLTESKRIFFFFNLTYLTHPNVCSNVVELHSKSKSYSFSPFASRFSDCERTREPSLPPALFNVKFSSGIP